jgi:hypothetical protein
MNEWNICTKAALYVPNRHILLLPFHRQADFSSSYIWLKHVIRIFKTAFVKLWPSNLACYKTETILSFYVCDWRDKCWIAAKKSKALKIVALVTKTYLMSARMSSINSFFFFFTFLYLCLWRIRRCSLNCAFHNFTLSKWHRVFSYVLWQSTLQKFASVILSNDKIIKSKACKICLYL